MTIIDDTTTRSEPTSLDVPPPEPFLYRNGDGEIPDGWALSQPPIGKREFDATTGDIASEPTDTIQMAFDPKRHTVVRGTTPDANELTPNGVTTVRKALVDAGFDCVDVPDSSECYFVRDRIAPENTRSAPGRSTNAGLGR